ncbi:DUF2809 domain-containing protein [Streptomyces paludis]|uniref:DUF2809 domain-containing protein n=1 Tax=Streptomyces paludis TaxID=2282738 RepID=A0A345I1M4_9ACTN|nr:DUF2809 domain-containing protein [Streptomyces paludis]
MVTVGAGLGVGVLGGGDVAKYGGDALYTVLVYAVVVFGWPRVRPGVAAVGAVGFSWGVELLQLTGVPAELAGRSVVARLVLGSTFNAPDLLWYAVGAGLCWAGHTLLRSGRGPARDAASGVPPRAVGGRSPGP